jgi:hypothetical protein
MAGTAVTILAIVLLFIGLAVLLLRFIDRRRAVRSRRSRASDATERQAYERRILEPDWAWVERYLGRPVPQALRELYSDRSLITRRDLNYDDDRLIGTFEPLDARAVLEAPRWPGLETLVIATTDFGDPVYVRVGATPYI